MPAARRPERCACRASDAPPRAGGECAAKSLSPRVCLFRPEALDAAQTVIQHTVRRLCEAACLRRTSARGGVREMGQNSSNPFFRSCTPPRPRGRRSRRGGVAGPPRCRGRRRRRAAGPRVGARRLASSCVFGRSTLVIQIPRPTEHLVAAPPRGRRERSAPRPRRRRGAPRMIRRGHDPAGRAAPPPPRQPKQPQVRPALSQKPRANHVQTPRRRGARGLGRGRGGLGQRVDELGRRSA